MENGFITQNSINNAVVGVWKWEAVAIDEKGNLQIGIQDWHLNDEVTLENWAKLGSNIENLRVTFYAEGTGYIWNNKIDSFTWREAVGNSYIGVGKNNEIYKFYLNSNNELVYELSEILHSENIILTTKNILVKSK